MAEVKYIEYQSQTILSVDFCGAISEFDVLEIMNKASKLISLNRKGNILAMYNLCGIKITARILKEALKYFKETNEKVTKRAFIIADDRLEKIINVFMVSNKINGETAVFNNETAAMNYLAIDDSPLNLIISK